MARREDIEVIVSHDTEEAVLAVRLGAALERHGFRVARVRGFDHERPLSEWFRHLTPTQAVVVLLSEAHLSSVDGMARLSEVSLHRQFRARIFVVWIGSEANPLRIENRSSWVGYWRRRVMDLDLEVRRRGILGVSEATLRDWYRAHEVETTVETTLDGIAPLELCRLHEVDVQDFAPLRERIRSVVEVAGRLGTRGSAVMLEPSVQAAWEGLLDASLDWASEVGEDAFGVYARLDFAGVSTWFRLVIAGTFMRGAREGEKAASLMERPQHRVTLTRNFWLQTTPCTQAFWRAVGGSEVGDRYSGSAYPVLNVPSSELVDFPSKLSAAVPNLEARLPTEAEWEYACRAGTSTNTYAGEVDGTCRFSPVLDRIAWYGANSGSGPNPVGAKRPNAFGLFDMLGLVRELTADAFVPYGDRPLINPNRASKGDSKTLRGGSWQLGPKHCRASARMGLTSSEPSPHVGLRLALACV